MTSSVSQWGRIPMVAALAVGLGLLLAGCGGGGGAARAGEEISLLNVETPLREPVYVREGDFTLALLQDEPRVVRLDETGEDPPGLRIAAHSEELEGTGENLAPNPEKPDEAYLPQPDLGRVVSLNTTDLRTGRSYDAGEAPEWAALHPGSRTLFALSEDGSTVSMIDAEGREETSNIEVDAGEGARIDAPERGLAPEFWVWGPEGISNYQGFSPELKVSLPINAEAFAPDIETAQRAYVGEGTRVVAVEGDPESILEGELEEVAEQDLGERAEHVEAEELRVFAATENKLVAMRRDNLDVLDTVDFRSFLEQRSLGDARISGMAVTRDRIYLMLEGEPYVLSIQKTGKTRA